MTPTRAAVPTIIAASIGLGIAADGLFRTPVWGLNLAIFVFSLAAWGARVGARSQRSQSRCRWPWVAACGFAAMWVFRDAETLLACDLLAALCLLTLPLAEARGVALRSAAAMDVLASPVIAAWKATSGGAAVLLRDLPWRESLGTRHLRAARAAAGGLLLSVPLILVFGSLFVSADPAFENLVSSVFAWGPGPALGHAAVIGVVTWVVAGYLRALAVVEPPRAAPASTPGVGFIPVATALAAMVVVFTLFVAVQAGSLYRGEAYVRAYVGLTFAEYARRGFFQLVAAAVLALPVVYAAPWLAGASEPRETRSMRALQSVALGLVGLVALSALWRMWLYVRAYGLTDDRLYGSAVILWIGGTIGVFARTILRGRPQGTVYGAVVSAVVVLALLNVVNPSALIARVNLGRAATRAVDSRYLASLGAEAVPVIGGRIAVLDSGARCSVGRSVADRWRAQTRGDWRGWNVARARAHAALPALARAVVSCPPPSPRP